jgi:hypothetical protein
MRFRAEDLCPHGWQPPQTPASEGHEPQVSGVPCLPGPWRVESTYFLIPTDRHSATSDREEMADV